MTIANPFLYDQSVADRGHLIIPFQSYYLEQIAIYSYGLLAAQGRKSPLHQQLNPAGLYSESIPGIITIAQEHLASLESLQQIPLPDQNWFNQRYTYQGNLIIVVELQGKFFYDHYNSHDLRNIAAPKIFKSAQDCLAWIKTGLDRSGQKA
jgi:hypothetical protein